MYIKRYLFKTLLNHLDSPEITIIVGPRQVGKTTLLLKLKEYLEKKGEKTLFLNYDLDKDRPFFSSQIALVNKIKLFFGNQKGFVFLDEIQRKENASLFLKGLYDMNLPYKFIVTGSGSLELKEKIHESLPGRKRLFYLRSVSFWEFLNFKTNYQFEQKKREFLKIEKILAKEILNEYLMFGGYPKVILAETLKEKQIIINDIFQSFLEKDISLLLQVEKTESLSKLTRLIAHQQGQLINYSELAGNVGISQPTVKKFLWYLEKTFILARVYPFSKKRKEIVKAPVVYFQDLGMANFLRGQFGLSINQINNAGLLFQNFIYQLLEEKIENTIWSLNYWRSKDGAEVDFVIDKGSTSLPVEVKYSESSDSKIPRGLSSFIKKYQQERAFVVNLNIENQLFKNSTEINFLPYYQIDKIFEN